MTFTMFHLLVITNTWEQSSIKVFLSKETLKQHKRTSSRLKLLSSLKQYVSNEYIIIKTNNSAEGKSQSTTNNNNLCKNSLGFFDPDRSRDPKQQTRHRCLKQSKTKSRADS